MSATDPTCGKQLSTPNARHAGFEPSALPGSAAPRRRTARIRRVPSDAGHVYNVAAVARDHALGQLARQDDLHAKPWFAAASLPSSGYLVVQMTCLHGFFKRVKGSIS